MKTLIGVLLTSMLAINAVAATEEEESGLDPDDELALTLAEDEARTSLREYTAARIGADPGEDPGFETVCGMGDGQVICCWEVATGMWHCCVVWLNEGGRCYG